MKKKASLLISGITTVAMLAVAVGSFAAWDTLKDEGNALSVTTSTPTLLTAEAKDNSNKEKLIPKNGSTNPVLITDGAKDSVKSGALEVTLTGDPTKVKVTPTIKVNNKELSDAANPYKVIIKDGENDVTNELTGFTSGTMKSYDVFVEFNDDSDTISGDDYKTEGNVSITIDLKAEAKTTV